MKLDPMSQDMSTQVRMQARKLIGGGYDLLEHRRFTKYILKEESLVALQRHSGVAIQLPCIHWHTVANEIIRITES